MRNSQILLIAALLSSLTSLGIGQTTFNGHTYIRTPPLTHANARQLAVNLGGHLVTIDDQAENDFVYQTFVQGTTQHHYIGLNDEAVENNFAWDSGAPLNFTNWSPGEPNGNSDFVVMRFQEGAWDDLGGNRPAIIEVPSLVVAPTFNGNAYLPTLETTVSTARLLAQSVGGHLVTIDSQAENDFLTATFGGMVNAAYIGLSDEITEGVFQWDSGAAVNFTNWNPGEPSGNGDFVVIGLGGGNIGGWDDREGTGINAAIIEIPLGTGQAPQAGVAVLDINGATALTGDPVSSGLPGPYFASAAVDGSLDFTLEGEAGQPIILLAGPLNPGVLNAAPFGQLDIGGPEFAGVTLVVDGSQPGFLNSLFVIGSMGSTNMSFVVPPNLSGLVIALQAVIPNTANIIGFSNAVQLTVTP